MLSEELNLKQNNGSNKKKYHLKAANLFQNHTSQSEKPRFED